MTRALGVGYVTPHCCNGGHENSKVLSLKGTLMPSCRGIYAYRFVEVKCTCWCHEMFASLVAEERDALTPATESMNMDVTAPSVDPVALGHVTDAGIGAVGAVIPERSQSFWASVVHDANVETQLWQLVNGLFFDDEVKREESANSGRRKRGSLDINVEIVCKLWLEEKLPFPELTPVCIGMMINAEDPPSSGAIYAVLTRWRDENLCAVSEKPFRFVSFTPAVGEYGIAYVKNKTSKEKIARSKGFF